MYFEKVSFEQYKKSIGGDITEEELKSEYDDIKLPKRATKWSAGYDFFAPFDIDLAPEESIAVPTGIRWKCSHELEVMSFAKPTFVLKVYPRSGLGFKHFVGLANTVGIIDEDYYQSENEGHIFVKLVNNGSENVTINKGQGFAQGIIVNFWVCDDDTGFIDGEQRNGGMGSTDKKTETEEE